MAKVSFNGLVKDISLAWLPEAKVGEYVMAHVGFALNKVDEEDARQTIDLLKQMGEL